MIPILYEKTETAFKSNGLGRLPDCPRCEVTEERNGIYECEFDYPVTGVNFSEIGIGRIVAVTHGEAGDLQPFDIYRKTEPIDGIVTFYAQHVSYRMNGITLKPFTASSCADVFTKIPGSSIGNNPFSFWTNKAVSSDFKLEEPRTLRSLLAGEEGSILDVYGTGEYEFDKFSVKLYLHRGSDTDVSIRYGKNLSDFESDTDAGDVYTAIVPFWYGTDEDDNPVLVTLPEWYVSSGEIAPGGREIIVPLDLSEAFEEAPTVSDLRDKATSRLANSKAWLPVQNISVDFVQLWQTEEYKQFAPLQRLGLCDTCEIVVPMYGYSFRAKVIRTVWNVLLDRYDEMELGDKLTTFADTLVKPVEDAVGKLEKAIRTTKSTIEAALEQGIADAMEQIRGGMGGYIVQTVNAQGQPIELLVTDNLDLTQAVNIWRWNLGGLAHSSHGYNGPYDVAITQDGKINASMILTGVLKASLITAGTISDSSGLNYWNLDTGVFVTRQGTLGDFTVDSTKLSKGSLLPNVYGGGMELSPDQIVFSDGNDRVSIDSGGTLLFEKVENSAWSRIFEIFTSTYNGSPVAYFRAAGNSAMIIGHAGVFESDCSMRINGVQIVDALRVPYTAKFVRDSIRLLNSSMTTDQTVTIQHVDRYTMLFFDAYVYNNSDTRYNGRTTMALTVAQIKGDGASTYTMGNSLGTCMFEASISGTTLTVKQLSGTGYLVQIRGI